MDVYVSFPFSKEDPDYLYNYLPKIKIIKTKQKLPWLFYAQFDKVYYIGGGVFFDYRTNMKKATYFKRYLANLIRFNLPRLIGTEFGGIGIGIGPYFNDRTRNLHGQILKNFKILGVRDQKSWDEADAMGIKKNMHLSNDLSIEYGNFLEQNKSRKRIDEVVICPRSYGHKKVYEKHLGQLLNLAEYIEENTAMKTHWIFLQHEKNKNIYAEINKADFKLTIWNPNECSILDFFNFFSQAKLTISSRMHSLYVSGLVGTPFIAIELHQKLRYASELFYENPVVIKPEANLNEYIQAFNEIEGLKMTTSKLKQEQESLRKLDSLMVNWLNT
ncbi:polysaccharide pyruvyl transferase family protein [Flavobacteriaceae bacterium F08102]|nr:polysaccharide pyruvyl transferase family protein [Flavobacteriaceae bacterium F08102]